MPQMGESIAEGTIVRWIKKVGDSVDRDEPLFEISTDKVDAEIPSPAAGTLLDISVKEGETVPVNSVVATIGAAGEAAPGATRAIGADDATDAAAVAATAPASGKAVPPVSQADGSPAPRLVECRSIRTRERRSLAFRPAADRQQFVTTGSADCERARHRHRPNHGHRRRRARHQAGHPRLSRQWPGHLRRIRPHSPRRAGEL